MNRIQFFVLTGLSSLVLLLLIGDIFLTKQAGFEANAFNQDRQTISLGQASQSMAQRLANTIYEESQKSQDPGLKALLVQEKIAIPPKAGSTNTIDSPAPPSTPSTP